MHEDVLFFSLLVGMEIRANLKTDVGHFPRFLHAVVQASIEVFLFNSGRNQKSSREMLDGFFTTFFLSNNRRNIFGIWIPFTTEWNISIWGDFKGASLLKSLTSFTLRRRFGMTRQLSVLIRNNYQSINSFMKKSCLLCERFVLFSTFFWWNSTSSLYWFLNFLHLEWIEKSSFIHQSRWRFKNLS